MLVLRILALSLQPRDPLTCKRRADVRGKLGKKEDALKDYRKSITMQAQLSNI